MISKEYDLARAYTDWIFAVTTRSSSSIPNKLSVEDGRQSCDPCIGGTLPHRKLPHRMVFVGNRDHHLEVSCLLLTLDHAAVIAVLAAIRG